MACGRSLEFAGLLQPAAAAEEFRQGFDLDVVELLGENPFPPTVLLRVKPDVSLARLDAELATLAAVPGVTGVHVECELLGEVGGALRRAARVALAITSLLGLLTLALLVAAIRSLRRAWGGEAALLDLQGARPGQLALPVLLALLLPALAAAALAQAGLLGLDWLARDLGLGDLRPAPVWPLWVGGALPLLAAWLILLRRRGA